MSSSDSDEGAWPTSVWPLSLTIGDTELMARYGVLVPPAAKVPGPWRIGENGIPTMGPPPTREQLYAFPGGRYNRRAQRRFWRGKNFDIVLGAFRDAAADRIVGDITAEAGTSRGRGGHVPPPAAPTAPAQQAPPALALVEIPPAQAALAQDGDPDDTSGLLAVLARLAEEAAVAATREERERLAAIAAVQEQQAQEDNWWDFSDDDDDGGDGGEGEAGGMAPVIDLTGASDDE